MPPVDPEPPLTKYEQNRNAWLMPLQTKKVLILTMSTETPYGVFRNLAYYKPLADFDPDADDFFEAVANGIHASIAAKLGNVIASGCTVGKEHVKFFDGDGNVWEGVTTSATVEGGIDDDLEPLPGQDALIIRKITGKVGPQNRGRFFISGIPEMSDIEGRLTPAGIAGWRTAVLDLAEILSETVTWNGVGWEPQHYNKKDDQLVKIRQCMAMVNLGSRRDRSRQLPFQAAY